MDMTSVKAKKGFVLAAGIAVFYFQLMTVAAIAGGDEKPVPAASRPAPAAAAVAENGGATEDDTWAGEDWGEEWQAPATIADPLEPVNRLFFHFNDKLYYWVLQPVATVYGAFFPEEIQIAVRNIFDNLRTPARAVDCLLQGRVRDSGKEVARFVLNSTVGIVGIGDFAKDVFGLGSTREDLGQTLASYGAGGGFYIEWPFLGPSNFRDSLGQLGDAFMNPFIFLHADWDVTIGAWVFDRVNYTALTLGDYELFTETALDPYTAVKDAYQQYREGLIKDNGVRVKQ